MINIKLIFKIVVNMALKGGIKKAATQVNTKVETEESTGTNLFDLLNPSGASVGYRFFDKDKYLILTEESKTEKYTESLLENEEFLYKRGQLKLLLSEIEFFTYYWDTDVILAPICIYIGAAPGVHLNLLISMFPAFEYHLYDTNTFDEQLIQMSEDTDNYKITIYNRYFNDVDVIRWQQYNDKLFLISDIRNLETTNSMLTNEEKSAENAKIWDDMQLQEAWVLSINPLHALLKFRMPWIYTFEESKYTNLEYLDGLVYLQQFTSKQSTENRLVPTRPYTKRVWNVQQYEDSCYYHNKYIRNEDITKFMNPITDNTLPIYQDMFLMNGYDAAAMTCILMDYFNKTNTVNNEINVKALMKHVLDNVDYKTGSLFSMKKSVKKSVKKVVETTPAPKKIGIKKK